MRGGQASCGFRLPALATATGSSFRDTFIGKWLSSMPECPTPAKHANAHSYCCPIPIPLECVACFHDHVFTLFVSIPFGAQGRVVRLCAACSELRIIGVVLSCCLCRWFICASRSIFMSRIDIFLHFLFTSPICISRHLFRNPIPAGNRICSRSLRDRPQ